MGCNVQCWCCSDAETEYKVITEEEEFKAHEEPVEVKAHKEPVEFQHSYRECSTSPTIFNDTGMETSTMRTIQVEKSQLYIQDTSPMLREGQLLKFKPGISKMFVDRWVQVTEFSISCFKSYDSARLLKRPLLQVPFREIDRVEKIPSKSYDNNHLFEIFMRNEDRMVEVSRELQKAHIDRKVVSNSYARRHTNAVVCGKLMKKPLRTSLNNPGKLSKNPGWSLREVEWYSSEKRLLFGAKSAKERDIWVSLITNAVNNNKQFMG